VITSTVKLVEKISLLRDILRFPQLMRKTVALVPQVLINVSALGESLPSIHWIFWGRGETLFASLQVLEYPNKPD